MQAKVVRRWSWVHKWSSLVCTVFLLLLCITGLPLIFHEEIDELLHTRVPASEAVRGAPRADLDKLVATGMAQAPGEFLHFVIWDREDPNVVFLSVAKKFDAPSVDNRFIRMDANTGTFLDAPGTGLTFTSLMLRLHTDMFAGLPGKLFLGLMGFLFCVAIVSGVVLYAPSMRKLAFGTVRQERSRLIRWVDLHNLLGAVTIVWVLVVGFTGVINTWADLVLKLWQFDQLSTMVGPYKDAPIPQHLTSVGQAVQAAEAKLPDMVPLFVAYPGTAFTSKAHYAIFLRGKDPVTSRLLQPVLIDAATGAFTDTRKMPWYVTTLLLSQPLHFGDYGGMPLKIVWAILDVFTIIVLISGLYIWLLKRRPSRASADDALVVPSTAAS
ncbi:MAG: PepSY domain-containing protein [Rhizobiales bacterium]|nr:PepSY domain-containing protein [Hyphomicrobiales bacterium]